MVIRDAVETSIMTARLRLRAFREADLDELVRLAGDWAVAQWLANLPHPYSETIGRDWIAHVRWQHENGRPRTSPSRSWSPIA